MATSFDPEPPRYLTDPAHSLGERHLWESRFKGTILDQMAGEPEPTPFVLTSAAFPRWHSLAKRILAALPSLPTWATAALYDWQVSEDATREEIAEALAATLATAAYNVHALQLMAEYGFPYKMWVTRHDLKVRPAHRALDGKRERLSHPFTMEGFHLQYPADRTTAPPHLTFRCRCVLVGRR